MPCPYGNWVRSAFFGCWLLVVGCWLLAVGLVELGSCRIFWVLAQRTQRTLYMMFVRDEWLIFASCLVCCTGPSVARHYTTEQVKSQGSRRGEEEKRRRGEGEGGRGIVYCRLYIVD